MSGRAAAWAGLGAGVGAAGLAAVLLQRTLTVALEIRRYADDIADAGQDIARNTEIVAELTRLGELAARIRAATAGPASEEPTS